MINTLQNHFIHLFFFLESTCFIVKAKLTLDHSAIDDEVEKVIPLFEYVLGVPETSIWLSDHDRYSDGRIRAFNINVWTTRNDEEVELMSKLKSKSFLDQLHICCKTANIRSWRGDILKFKEITEPSTEEIKGIKIY